MPNRITQLLITLTLTFLLAIQSVALEIDGKWIQGGMLIGKVEPGTQVAFDERQLRVSEEGIFVFGLGRDAPVEATLTITAPSGDTETHRFAVEQREYNIQRIEGVPPRTVNPPAEEMDRIRQESQLSRQARNADSIRQNFLTDFQWPLLGPITGVYGSQRVYNGEPRRPHYGVDIARPTGTPIVAPLPGVVALSHDNMFFNGGTLILDHGHGISTTYIHLSKLLVKKGDEISQGQVIAEVGATGRVTGPHLHWSMNWFSQPLDPQLLVGPMPPLEDDPQ